MIANAQSEIQIVDTHESLETLINVDVAAGTSQFNRTLVNNHKENYKAANGEKFLPDGEFGLITFLFIHDYCQFTQLLIGMSLRCSAIRTMALSLSMRPFLM